MLEEEIARWMTFNSDDFKSKCCRCHSSLTSINSCISSSQLRINKYKVDKPNKGSLKIRTKEESTKNKQNLLCQKMTAMQLNEKKPSSIKSKFRSVSVDDLEYVVKELIEDALEDDEETIQLQMLVCREDYLPKFMKVKTENDSKKILAISNNKKEKSEETNLETIVSKISNHNEEIQLNKENSEKNLKKIATSMNLNEDSIVLKHPENKENEETKNIENGHRSEGINEYKDLKRSAQKNLRSKLTKNQEENDKKGGIILQKAIQRKVDFTFEAWKQAKTTAYKQILKEEKRKRQRELLENAKKLERERAAHFVYLNWKRDQQKEQKLKRMNAKIADETAMALKIKCDENRCANLQAFKEWKKQKNDKIKREKMMWGAYSQQYYQQNIPTPPEKTETCKPKMNLDFDTLLNQLDNVLHQKYLRERRFQVRSFYCQPAYYGTAVLIQ